MQQIKILSTLFLLLIFSGCAVKDGLGERAKIDPTLPKPQNIRTLSDRSSIGFEWEYVKNQEIAGYKIYKNKKDGSSEVAATLKDRFISHYTDSRLDADTMYSYRFSSFTKDGVESDATPVVAVKTMPQLEPISFVAGVNNLPNRAKIVWRPHTSVDVTSYIIQKSGTGDTNWKELATVEHRLSAEYIDTDVKSGGLYKYRVFAKTFDGALSLPSQIVEVNTKSLPLAAKSIYATKDLPKQIVVSWEAEEQKDFSHYKLYSSDKPDGSYISLYSGNEKKFIDKINEDGAVRYYRVGVIDKDGLESPYTQSATGFTKPKPITPVFTLATIKENRVHLAWSSSEKESVTFKITKRWGNFLNKQQISFKDIKGFSFEDKDVDLGQKYLYSIEAIDKDGISSKPSDEVELFVPKGL